MPSWILPLSVLSLPFLLVHIIKILSGIKGQLEKSRDYSEQLKEINKLLMAIGHVAQGNLCINCGERHHYSDNECRNKENELDEFLNTKARKKTKP